MNEHQHPSHEHSKQELVTNLPKRPQISWGAIIAGLFAVISTSWLLYLLGGAIGVSVADASDSTLIGEGLSQGAIVWITLSALIAYFIGAATASRLAGVTDETDGMLHGFTMWGVATTVTLLLGYWGVTSLLQTGAGFVQDAAAATGTAITTTANAAGTGAAGVSQAVMSAADSEVGDRLRQRLLDSASQGAAQLDPEGGPEIKAEEVRKSIEELDRQTLESLVEKLTSDDRPGAAKLLASESELSADQARELIDGAYRALEERLGDPDDDESLTTDLRQRLASGAASALAPMDAQGGPKVTDKELKKAIEQLDAQTLGLALQQLVNGKPAAAEKTLASNTGLSKSQVGEVVEGFSDEYEEQLTALESAANDVVETISSYSQGVLWTTFTATALGLAISVLGGWCGADTTRRLYVESHEHDAHHGEHHMSKPAGA